MSDLDDVRLEAEAEEPPADDDLYRELDQLHGQVLRAKYRLRENPDRDKLADLVADLCQRAKLVESAWQAHEAAQHG